MNYRQGVAHAYLERPEDVTRVLWHAGIALHVNQAWQLPRNQEQMIPLRRARQQHTSQYVNKHLNSVLQYERKWVTNAETRTRMAASGQCFSINLPLSFRIKSSDSEQQF